jgi:hypothetical protein
MSAERPENVPEYEQWLERRADYNKDNARSFYEIMAAEVRRGFQQTALWQGFTDRLQEFDQEYRDKERYPLLMNLAAVPELRVKAYDSFLEKTYRLNTRFRSGFTTG